MSRFAKTFSRADKVAIGLGYAAGLALSALNPVGGAIALTAFTAGVVGAKYSGNKNKKNDGPNT